MKAWPEIRARADEILVAGALLAIAGLCVVFRYLPMTDLPQHYAMVSILAHLGDPAWGFGERYSVDLLGLYSSVYAVGGLLAKALPLAVVMKLLVALCTAAPMAGLYALLRAAGRPRFWALCAAPFAFGYLWHWGFLNFYLGVGVLEGALALVILGAGGRRGARGGLVAVSLLLLLTHFHAFLLLLMLAPLLAWAWRAPGTRPLGVVGTLVPLVPAALLAAVFVLTTWKHALGFGRQRSPDLLTRVMLFPLNLGGGELAPWPLLEIVGLAVIALTAAVLARRAGPGEGGVRRAALGVVLGVQVVLYLAMPLQTETANMVYPRQALLMALAVPLVLPALEGRARALMRGAAALFAAAGLLLAARHLRRFDADARDFEPLVAGVPQDQRIAAMVFQPTSWAVDGRLSPYLHFPVYLQAFHGGDVSFSFANHWNIPVQYRSDRPRHALAAGVEWHPNLLSMSEDLPYFDYLVYRTGRPPRLPEGVRVVASSGPWTLVQNPGALPTN